MSARRLAGWSPARARTRLRRKAASGAGPVRLGRVSTVDSRALAQLSEAQPDDFTAVDDPAEAVTSSMHRRPERAEATILVEIPLALRGTTIRLDVARAPVHIECLCRPVVVDQLAGRHCSWDQGRRHRLAVNDLDIFQALHQINLLRRSGLVRTQSVSLNRVLLWPGRRRSSGPARQRGYGLEYPVGLDDDFVAWNAYGNRYWPT